MVPVVLPCSVDTIAADLFQQVRDCFELSKTKQNHENTVPIEKSRVVHVDSQSSLHDVVHGDMLYSIQEKQLIRTKSLTSIEKLSRELVQLRARVCLVVLCTIQDRQDVVERTHML